MPSGSHGGHSHSGGSRSGGSSSHGSSFRGGSYSRGPRIYHFGRSYYVVPSKYSGILSLLTFFIVFSIFFIFAGTIMFTQAKGDIQKVERDFFRYQNMIAYAHQHPELIVDGTIENHYYDEAAEKWYITYSFRTNDNGNIPGETYCVYTAEDLLKEEYRVGSVIRLAVDRVPEHYDDDVDSIPLDYEFMTIEQDGFYIVQQNTMRVGKIMLIVASIALGGTILINILVVATTKKKSDKNGNPIPETASTTSTKTSTPSTTDQTHNHTYCDYCGAKLPNTASKCPNCGAKLR